MSSPASSEPASTPDPRGRLGRRARTVWRLRLAGLWLGLCLAGWVLSGPLPDGWPELAARLAPPVGLLVAVTVVPELRWRHWRYEVREEEVDLRHGAFVVTRTLVPMRRVQHVDSTRGVLEQAFGLATVVFHTAAGSHTVPLLEAADAGRVRDRIAELARVADEL